MFFRIPSLSFLSFCVVFLHFGNVNTYKIHPDVTSCAPPPQTLGRQRVCVCASKAPFSTLHSQTDKMILLYTSASLSEREQVFNYGVKQCVLTIELSKLFKAAELKAQKSRKKNDFIKKPTSCRAHLLLLSLPGISTCSSTQPHLLQDYPFYGSMQICHHDRLDRVQLLCVGDGDKGLIARWMVLTFVYKMPFTACTHAHTQPHTQLPVWRRSN